MSPPARPPAWQESLGRRLFQLLAPRVGERPRAAPPSSLSPFEEITFGRPWGAGILTATRFPARGARPRGTVLLLHPWTAWGRAYFHRHGRIEALRAAGFEAVAVDLPGFGGSGPVAGFPDRDVEGVVAALRRHRPGRPLALWGVSSGGYWGLVAACRLPAVSAALFEDVSPHLLEWSGRVSPWGRPFYALFRALLPAAYRYLDLRGHAPSLLDRSTLFTSGELDVGVPPEDTRELAARAGGRHVIVPGAPHLGALKVAPDLVLDPALALLDRLEAGAETARTGLHQGCGQGAGPPAAVRRPGSRAGRAAS
jgi:pimeloyl-ACP methyl ester carboxylesterase